MNRVNNTMYLFLLFQIVFLVSCNTKQKVEEKEYRQWLNPDDKLEMLHIDLDVKVNANDEFKIYYTDDNTMDFNEDNTIRVKVRADSVYQKVVFNFSKQTKPTNIRIDFGFSREQKMVGFKKMSFVYKDKDFQVVPKDLLKFFTLNKSQLSWEESTNFIVMKNLESEGYFPYIFSKDTIQQALFNILDY